MKFREHVKKSSNSTKKPPSLSISEGGICMELIARFELATSSLPTNEVPSKAGDFGTQ